MITDWGLKPIRPKEKIEEIHEKAEEKVEGFKEGGFGFVGPALDINPKKGK